MLSHLCPLIQNASEDSHLVEDRGKGTWEQWCRCGLKVGKKDYLLFQKQEASDDLAPNDPGMGVGGLETGTPWPCNIYKAHPDQTGFARPY